MATPDRLEDKIPRREIIIATLDNAVVGYLRLEKIWNNFPFISWIYVQEKWRGQGIGTSLLQFLEKELRSNHAGWLLSSSEASNSRAIEWHKKRNFLPAGYWEGTHKDGSNELFFKKAVA